MSRDLNPKEHIWDMLSRRVQSLAQLGRLTREMKAGLKPPFMHMVDTFDNMYWFCKETLK